MTSWEKEGEELAKLLLGLRDELTVLVKDIDEPYSITLEPISALIYQLTWVFPPSVSIENADHALLMRLLDRTAKRVLAPHQISATTQPLSIDSTMGTEAVSMHIYLPDSTKTGVLKHASRTISAAQLNEDKQGYAKTFVNWLNSIASELKQAVGEFATGPVFQTVGVLEGARVSISFYLPEEADEGEARLVHNLVRGVLQKLAGTPLNDFLPGRLKDMAQLSFWNALDWQDKTPSFYVGTACHLPNDIDQSFVHHLNQLLGQQRADHLKEQEAAEFDEAKASTFVSHMRSTHASLTKLIEEIADVSSGTVYFVEGLAEEGLEPDVTMEWHAEDLGEEERRVLLNLLRVKLQFAADRIRPTWMRSSYEQAAKTLAVVRSEDAARGITTYVHAMFALPSSYPTFVYAVSKELE